VPIKNLKNEQYLIRGIQWDVFNKEIDDLNKNRNIDIGSKITKYSPLLVKEQICMANRRVVHIVKDIILDNTHTATRILINDYHRKYYHSNNKL
jgi:hypothetical protein